MTYQERVREAASGFLEAGEQVEFGMMAQVGQVSVKRQIATAAAVAVLTAGMATAFTRPALRVLVLTNQRLLFLDATSQRGRPMKKLLGALPREVLSIRKRRTFINTSYDLTDNQGSGTAIRIKIPWWRRKLGARLAAELSATARSD
jgi:5-enolpyruvylshikimate-3-phosphate synthase